MIAPCLYIPLEIFKREWLSKLLIAVLSASRGINVVIGHKSSVTKLAKKSKCPGIFFNKSARGPGHDYMKELKLKGFKLIAQDEEAGIIFDDFEVFYNKRSSLSNISELDGFFCWGQDDYNFLMKKFDANVGKILKMTGSPRASLWGGAGECLYGKDIKSIKKKYGNYVLLATNFAAGNAYLSDENNLRLQSSFPAWDAEKFEELVNFDKRMFRLFLEAAVNIADKIGVNVVIRPHPTENIEAWRNAVRGHKGVFVESRGDITPWILSSNCLIQNGCTSSLEAVSAGVPVIALGENDHDLFDSDNVIPNKVAIPIKNINCLLKAVSGFLQEGVIFNRPLNIGNTDLLNQKVINANSMKPVYEITEVIIELSNSIGKECRKPLGRDSILNDLIECFRMSMFRLPRTVAVMDQHKRPTIKSKKVREDIELSLKVLRLNQKIEFKRIGVSCFHIYQG